MARRTAGFAITVALLSPSGCATTPCGISTGTDQPSRTTVAPAQLPDSEATDRALDAETDYVSSRLRNASCLDYWELGQFTAEARATATNRTHRGVVVDVQRPYSWGKDELVADEVLNGRSLVTENETTRRSGQSIAPC